MEIYVYWFLLSLLLLGLEMATGTFYLLVVSIAAVVGGSAAMLGTNIVAQLLLAALTVVAGTMFLRRRKSPQVNETVNESLDVGQPVKVLKWHDDERARVHYRGTEWDAEVQFADTPHEGTLYIAAIHGSNLVLTDRNPQNK